MRVTGSLLMFLILVVGSNACFEPPQFSNIPSIEFNSIIFRTPPDSSQELDLTINFKDGDGDLGLNSNDSSDVLGVYAPQFFFFTNGKKVSFAGGSSITNPAFDGTKYDSLISYRTKRKAAGTANDTLPAFVSPYWCTNWIIISDPVDTIYCQLNPNTYNIFVDFLVKQNNGSFSLFDWTREYAPPYCQPSGYDGRFPTLSSDPSKPPPLEGKIKYNMRSSGWTALFSTKTLKLNVSIQDRALHRSNRITTPEFQLK